MTMQTDSILAFSIAHAIQERPDLVQADILKLMSRQIELEDENQELRRLVDRWPVTGIGSEGH
jgi:hypothetical protein